jgi:hypothetical protein
MRGTRNGNCVRLKDEFGFSGVNVIPHPDLAEDEIELPGGDVVSAYHPTDPF